MAKSLSSFLEDCRREIPNEIVHVKKEVDPAHYDVTAIIKHLGEMKKFPILVFEKPLNLYGKPSEIKLTMNCEISQGKAQIALGLPKGTSRERMAEVCLEREEQRIPPIVVEKKEAPVKEVVKVGKDADIFEIPIMRHHYMDGGPYITLSSISRDPNNGVYNCSYHRMEVKSKNSTALHASPRHLWKIFRDYEERNVECPIATVLGHHPAYHMGACYTGPFEVSEFDVIGGYLQEPLRLTPSETWGEDFLVPADAEIVIEGRSFQENASLRDPLVRRRDIWDPSVWQPVYTMRLGLSLTVRGPCTSR
jgi:UbiD family decarboxylase